MKLFKIMKKYFINDKEVKMGDTVKFESFTYNDEGVTFVTREYTLTPKIVEELKIMGKLKVEDNSMSPKELLTAAQKKIVDKIVKSHSATSTAFAYQVIDSIFNVNPSALLSMFLKEMAIILDKEYPDHITEAKELFVFENTTGKIKRVISCKDWNFNTFAAFRSLEDITLALKAVEGWLTKIYGKQKN